MHLPLFPVNFRIPSFAIASTLLLASAQAGVSVHASAQPPTKDVAISFIVPDQGAVGYQWRSTADNGRRDLGQTFTPPKDFTLKQITVQLQSGSGVGAKDAPFRLAIFELKGKVISRTLTTLDGNLPKEISPANTFLSFDLSDENIEFKSGATYGFLFIFEEPADSRALSLQSANVNTEQPTIRRMESVDGTSLTLSKAALEFYLQSAAPLK